MGEAIVVVVAGANEIVASGLRTILETEPDIQFLADFPRFEGIPDVIVYDVIGLETDGGAELFTLTERSDSAVVVVGRDLRPDLAARALAHGAAGCFSLEADHDSVLAVLRAAAHGDLDADDAKAESDVLGVASGLTRREVQVLGEITRGLSNDEIGHLLGISPNTLKSYIRVAYRKIGVINRAQAVAWCLRHGFDPPTP